jgi:hypothetical protein
VFDIHTPFSLWKLAVHVPMVQVLFEHIAVPFVVEHLFSHDAQLFASFVRLISHPFVLVLSQSANPTAQAYEVYSYVFVNGFHSVVAFVVFGNRGAESFVLEMQDDPS